MLGFSASAKTQHTLAIWRAPGEHGALHNACGRKCRRFSSKVTVLGGFLRSRCIVLRFRPWLSQGSQRAWREQPSPLAALAICISLLSGTYQDTDQSLTRGSHLRSGDPCSPYKIRHLIFEACGTDLSSSRSLPERAANRAAGTVTLHSSVTNPPAAAGSWRNLCASRFLERS